MKPQHHISLALPEQTLSTKLSWLRAFDDGVNGRRRRFLETQGQKVVLDLGFLAVLAIGATPGSNPLGGKQYG